LLSTLELSSSLQEPIYSCRRQTLLNAKKNIGEMSRRMELKKDAKKVERSFVELLGDVKQVLIILFFQLVLGVRKNARSAMENAEAFVDVAVGSRRSAKDGLSAQWEDVDASLISLTTKIAVLGTSTDQVIFNFRGIVFSRLSKTFTFTAPMTLWRPVWTSYWLSQKACSKRTCFLFLDLFVRQVTFHYFVTFK